MIRVGAVDTWDQGGLSIQKGAKLTMEILKAL